MKHIKFVKNSGCYSTGDTAGFADELADTYIARGDAVDVVAVIESLEITGDGAGEALPPVTEDPATTARTGKPRK